MGTTTYPAANADNGYTSLTAPGGNASFTYDSNGNMTYDGFNTLSYDVENRLVEAQNGAWGTSTYLYDPLGHRKEKQVASGAWVTTTQFVLAGNEEIADYNGVGGPLSLTVRGAGGLPVAAVTPAVDGATLTAVYYHHDAMGSTVAVTQGGDSGAADTYTYSDYGAPQSGSWSAYQYAGYRYDSETGLYYVKARYYSPNLGRFLQSDPVGFRGGMNLYAYVGNDPINLIDPMGMTPDGSNMTIPSVPLQNLPLQGYTCSQLSSTVTGFVAPNGNGGYVQSLDRAFQVNPPQSGQIVQENIFTNSAGIQIPPTWEVWNVSAQGIVTPSAGTVGLNDPLGLVPSNTNDMTYAPPGATVTQSATFYPGLQVPITGPGAFLPGNVPESLGLPSTYTNPNLPGPGCPTASANSVSQTYPAPKAP